MLILLQDFLRITKIKAVLLVLIGIVILVSGFFAGNVIYCFAAPCPQATSTVVGQFVYSIFTFNEFFINTQLALGIKNFLQPLLSADTAYLIMSFGVSMVIWYALISLVMSVYSRVGGRK